MDTVMLEYGSMPDLPMSFPVDEYAMVIGASRREVSVHIFRTPVRADRTHAFLYEHVRLPRDAVFATGGSVIMRTDAGERIVHMAADLGPCQVDMSGDTPYADRAEVVEFVSTHLAALKADTAAKRLPRLVLRCGTDPEILVDPRSLAIHADGLFRIGHGWLMRWDEISDLSAPVSPDAAADLRLYAVDGRCVVIRIDLL